MPNGIPTPEQLWNGEVSFFSLDTDLIQSAGYDFSKGSLNQLPKQIPRTMSLQMTEIVVSEIVSHLIEPVAAGVNKFESAVSELQRRTNLDMVEVVRAFASLNVEKNARISFREKIENFCNRCRGGVLPIAGIDLATEIFEWYFQKKAPFADKKDKKAEFPDAASLALLERYAEENQTMGIVASGDAGWGAFSAASTRIFCVRSIDQLADLFIATGAHGQAVNEMVLQAARRSHPALSDPVDDALRQHFADAEWVIDEIHSSISARVETEVYDVSLEEYEIDLEVIKAWAVDDDPMSWTIELEIDAVVKAYVQITHYVWDYVDREEVRLTSDVATVEHPVKVPVFLSCKNVRINSDPSDWDIDVEISAQTYKLAIGEVEPFHDSEWEM